MKETKNRREMIKDLGLVLLSVQVLPLSWASAEPPNTENMLLIKSGPSRFASLPGHFHFLNIPMSDIQNPPAEGIKLKTSTAYLHHHTVALSSEQLKAVAQGATITVPDTVTDHLYKIEISKS